MLFGQRRIGKTSILLQLQRRLPSPPFSLVYFDLMDCARKPIGQLLFELASTIADEAGMALEAGADAFDSVLTEAIENAFAPLGASNAGLTPVQELSNSEVLAVAALRMDETQGKRLGKLLDRQQAGKLREAERRELTALMQVHHENLVRKAQALHEAVRRGLREPLDE